VGAHCLQLHLLKENGALLVTLEKNGSKKKLENSLLIDGAFTQVDLGDHCDWEVISKM